ncbi:hypothetical protein CFOL_v3_34898 [Cephalotus follicularis]|uniref:Reverse transcriptase domain-containing protein n=1 Tax=Cephalotus follicularis TaxID=3775 RepID=A0A1Q3DGS1_CEPFO|nr:hypothetical protein CFOL_v3_34898 [Cephalotus follicularis]
MKIILLEIIFEKQDAFVPGRLITDNILVEFEVMHHIETRDVDRDRFCHPRPCPCPTKKMASPPPPCPSMGKGNSAPLFGGVGTGMEKSTPLPSLMACVRSTTYSVLVNGEP